MWYLDLIEEMKKEYEVEFIQKSTEFEVYKLTWNISNFRKILGEPTFSYLILCDLKMQNSYEQVLDKIKYIDQQNRKSNDLICVLKEENPLKEKSFWFNGRDFCHFMFVSPTQKIVVSDTDFSYNSSKQIKKQMKIVESIIQKNMQHPL